MPLFFNPTATTQIYSLSLHDALPILDLFTINIVLIAAAVIGDAVGYALGRHTGPRIFSRPDSKIFKQVYLRRTQAFYEKRSEEHTSELQSRLHLVCRLLLEKKYLVHH